MLDVHPVCRRDQILSTLINHFLFRKGQCFAEEGIIKKTFRYHGHISIELIRVVVLVPQKLRCVDQGELHLHSASHMYSVKRSAKYQTSFFSCRTGSINHLKNIWLSTNTNTPTVTV